MAENFEDVVKKLGSTVKKPSAGKAENVLAVQMVDSAGKVIKEEEGAAAAEAQREEEKRGKKSLNLLQTIADAVGGTGGGGSSAEDKKSGGMLTGIASALGRMGSGVGKGIGGFVKGIGSAAGSAGQFAVVMTAVGAGIAGFITALGAGAWAVAKMMPTIAEGLKSFDGINGSNLGKVGKGMGHLGVGLAAIGTGGAIAGIGGLVGSIADGIGGLFGAESGQEQLMTKLKKFSEVKLNVKNIKDNAEAMVAYGVAMTAGGAGSMMGSLATLADGAIGGLGKLLGGVPVVTQLINFSKVDIDGVKVKKNADAMVVYAKAMTAGAGATAMKSVAGVFTMIDTFTSGVSKLLGGKGTIDTQLDDLKKISAASDSIDGTKIKSVAGAMVWYAAAMTAGTGASAMKAIAGLGNALSTGLDGISKMLGGKGVIDTQLGDLKKITLASDGIDSNKVKNVAGAMLNYAVAMTGGAGGSGMKAVAGLANLFSTFFDGLSTLLGGKSTLDNQLIDLKKITLASDDIDPIKIKNVAKALSVYATAMAAGAKGTSAKTWASIANFAGGVVTSLGNFLGIAESDPIGDLKKFALKVITPEEVAQIKSNASGLNIYAAAMKTAGEATKDTAWGNVTKLFAGIVGSLGNLLGTKKSDPIGDLKKFALKSITPAEVVQIKSNASGLQAYADATTIMANLKVDKDFGDVIGDLLSGIGSWFSSSDEEEDPMAALDKFAAKKFNVVQIKKNIGTFQEFANFKYDRRSNSLKAFAEDLKKSVPIIEAAIMGSEDFKWFGKNIEIKGLASDDIKYEEAAKNIRMLRKALGAEVSVTTPTGTAAQGVSQAALARQATTNYGGGTTSINTGGNVVSSSTTNYVNNGTAARRPVILGAMS